MIEYVDNIPTPTGEVGIMLKMTVEKGKALNLPIPDAPNGKGSFSAYVRSASGITKIYVKFCADTSLVNITTNWQRIEIKGIIDNELPIQIAGIDEDSIIYIHKAQLEESHTVTDWTPSPGELRNGSVRIDEQGVEIKGGTVSIKAGAVFEVLSEGIVRIDAGESEGSYINLDKDAENIGTAGGVNAKTGAFSSGLTLHGISAATVDMLDNRQIRVGFEEPTNVHNILWFKPNSEKTVHYTAYTGGSRSQAIGFGFTNPIVFSLTASGTTALSASQMFVYKLSVVLYNTGNTDILNRELTLTLKKSGNQISQTITGITIQPFRTGTTVNFEIESDYNFASDLNPITCEFSLPAKVGSLYVNMQQTIDLNVTDKYASSSASPCSIYYIP